MKNILYLFIFTAFISCEFEKEIDYKTLYSKDLIVVQGYICTTDGLAFLVIKKSIPPNKAGSNINDVIEDAKVFIYKNNTLVDSIINETPSNYFQKKNVLFADNQASYHIVVESQRMGRVFSKVQEKIVKAAFDSIIFYFVPNMNNQMNVRLTFTQKTLNEYYHLGYKAWHENELYLGGMDFSTMGVLASTRIGENSIVQEIGYVGSHDTNGFVRMVDSVEVTFSSISKDFFKYMNSVNDYETTRDDWNYLNVQPVYSNIEGGAGIFGLVSRDRYTIRQGR